MAHTRKNSSLETKKAFVAKNRRSNYRASLRLEGIETPSSSPMEPESKAAIIARYQVPKK